MNLRPALSIPLPWLAAVAKLLAGSRRGSEKKQSSYFFPRTLSFTKEGTVFIVILFITGIAAINTGNNLLYLIAATMLSFIVISGVLSEAVLRGIEVSRTFPEHIFAQRPVCVRLHISNQKKILPSFSFIVEEIVRSSGEEGGWLSAESGYVVKLNSRSAITKTITCTFRRRGVYKLEGVRLKTRFPFGFFVKGRRLYEHREVIVFPDFKPIRCLADLRHVGYGQSSSIQKGRKGMKGSGSQLFNLRHYLPVDDARLIHWKSSAKTGALTAKEFEREGVKRVRIVFYNAQTLRGCAEINWTNYLLPEFKARPQVHSKTSYSPADATQKSGKKTSENVQVISAQPLSVRFEKLVETAAATADIFIRSGYEVGFESLNATLPCKSGKDQLYRILRELALIEPCKDRAGRQPDLKVIV